MTPLDFVVSLALISVVAGALGALVGLGGGVVIVPVLTILYGINIRLAIGASIVSVIATSSGAAAAYVRERMANLRVGMFLEVATTTGALSGAFLTTVLPARLLFVFFAAVLGYSALATFKRRHRAAPLSASNDRIANALSLHGSYYDPAERREIAYHVVRTRLGLTLMYVAGLVSALLGIGSGALKVPAMDGAMRLPMKVSTATSNFMIGVTAAASAGVYFMRGQIDPIIAAPVAVGILAGATIGARVLNSVTSATIRIVFVVVLVAISLEMLQKGIAG
ncbi:MAG: sulfite exporter TauE/SafE family protein [Actinomycetota bacterium]|nr:sulfite exporter TauE/SafE family protein [Actinomycetota bacterium]